MKSKFFLAVMSGLVLFLSSCGENTLNVSSFSEETSIEETTQSSSLSPTEKILWNDEVDALLGVSLGNYSSYLPVLYADYYEGDNALNERYGITYTSIICLGEGMEDGAKNYSRALSLLSFDVSYNDEYKSYGAIKRVAFDSLMQVTFFSSINKDNRNYTGIACWIYHDKVTKFPSEEVNAFLGEDIPVIEAPFYSFSKTEYLGTAIFCLYCYGLESSSYDDYKSMLAEDSWTIEEESGVGVATSSSKKCGLNFGFQELEDGTNVLAVLCYKNS